MILAAHAFRHYDIRGIMHEELFVPEMYRLGRAIAVYILEQHPAARTVLVGRDGRLHSPPIHQQIVQAFFDVGFAVHDAGICPTPVVYFGAHLHHYDAAVMITASHNGPEYNGLKICLGTDSVWGSQIQQIKDIYYASLHNDLSPVRVQAAVGSYSRVALCQEYADYMAEHFVDLRDDATPIVADCGNGAVGAILREVVDAVGLRNVTILCEAVDGTYPNHAANPVEPENMHHVIDYVAQYAPAVAVGFDGDGDRMAAVTHEGDLLAGDFLVALFAQDILHEYHAGSVVYDGKCSLVVADTVVNHGGIALRSPSGHSIIKHRMKQASALFGGELSGHFFFADCYFGFDDGIYAFLRLIRLLKKSHHTLAERVQQFPRTYSTSEIRSACHDAQKNEVIQRLAYLLASQQRYTISYDDGIRLEDGTSWGLIRASNTQPALCMRAESRTACGLQEIKKLMNDMLELVRTAPDQYQLELKELL